MYHLTVVLFILAEGEQIKVITTPATHQVSGVKHIPLHNH